jgi:transglutaminase-like putative cysteine protease/tetratricopeptide (TPR) repeat protein
VTGVRHLKRILPLWAAAIVLLSLVSGTVLLAGTGQSAPGAKPFEGRFWYFVDDLEFEGDEDPEIRFWAALPINHRGQTAEIEAIYPEPVEVIRDPVHGNEIVFWRVFPADTRERLYFYYDFKVFTEEVNTSVDPEQVLPYDKESALYKRYTRSEAWVEITPAIEERAHEIVGDEPNPYHQAKRIFDWVLDYMRYEYPDMDSRGAAISFERGKGDCGEYSFVFVSLCRAVGIPARGVVCIWPHTEGGHGWAEFYLPPYGWIPVDPSLADLVTSLESSDPSYDLDAVGGRTGVLEFMQVLGMPTEDPGYLFGNLYPNRIIVNVGPNVEAISNETGLRRTFRYMQPGGLASHPHSIEFQGISEKTAHGGFYLFGVQRDDFEFAASRADQYFANTYLEQREYDKAESGLLKRVEEQPWDAGAWLGLAIVYKKRGEYCSAIKACKKAIAGQGGSSKPVVEAWARTVLGNCYDVKGLRNWAVRQYARVMEMEVDYKDVADSAGEYLQSPYVPSEEECADTEPHKVVKLEDLRCDRKWLTELGCVRGCLDFLDVDVSDAWLYGGTGYAFILNIHENILSNSVGVWNNERVYELGKNLGYETEIIEGLRSQEDFEAKQKLAWDKARRAIDDGLPCYGFNLLIAEEYVIDGYDDCGYYFNGAMRFEGDGPKPWAELGDDDIGYLAIRVIRPCGPSSDTKTVKEALQFAIEHSESPEKWIYPTYRSGPAGYDLWIKALEGGRADGFGTSYLAVVFSECRSFAVPFLAEARGRLSPELHPLFDVAIAHYEVAAENLSGVANLFPFLETTAAEKSAYVTDPERRDAAIEYLKAARDAEADGLKALQGIVDAL